MSSINLIYGSCLDQNVDVIVNAANRYLVSGGGICGAIFGKAGYEKLKNECEKINRPLNDGDAVITSSCDIENAKYIIHAVGPDFNKTPNALDKLYNAYYNSLALLKKYNLHSISFPLISSGIFGGNNTKPASTSIKECINAYNDFINENKEYEIDVRICAYSDIEYKEVKELFETLNVFDYNMNDRR